MWQYIWRNDLHIIHKIGSHADWNEAKLGGSTLPVQGDFRMSTDRRSFLVASAAGYAGLR